MLRPSRLWKDSSEGAEEMDVGRRFHSETAGEEGVKEDRVLGLFLVQSLCFPGVRVAEETCYADVYEAVVNFFLLSIPRRICLLRCSGLVRFRFSSMDVTVPGDLSVYLLVTHLAARC